MKKKLMVLFTIAAMLAAVPTTGLAAPVKNPLELQKIRSIPGFEDIITIQEVMLDENTYLSRKGEDEYEFEYEKRWGTTVRFYLLDEDKVGMTIKIYDSSNNVVASGHTSSSNSWKVLNTFTPAKKDQTYTVRIVSDNGAGGYGYVCTVRAF